MSVIGYIVKNTLLLAEIYMLYNFIFFFLRRVPIMDKNFIKFISNKFDYTLHGDLENESKSESETLEKTDNNIPTEKKELPQKYEEKYMERYRNYDESKDIFNIPFTDEETALKEKFAVTLRAKMIESMGEKIVDCNRYITAMSEIMENKEVMEEWLICKNKEAGIDYEKVKNNKIEFERLEKTSGFMYTESGIIKDIEKRKNELLELEVEFESKKDDIEYFKDEAINIILDKRLDKLKNSVLMEKTPLGNVLIFWNNEQKSFTYYSDNTIPYRFLETVGRKYALTFKCKSVFVDMETEIKEAELKLEEDKRLEKEEKEREKEEKEKMKMQNANPLNIQKSEEKKEEKEKKNVFAKFKTYNTNNSKSSASVAPPKNNINSQSQMNANKQQEKAILKERANRYRLEGKLLDYNIIQKIDKKKLDKRLKMSFSDYKAMMSSGEGYVKPINISNKNCVEI